jgi:nucleoside-diphosphate-sugar epimerase
MRVLVTGAAGRLGVYVVGGLRVAGHEVIGCDIALESPRGDLTDFEAARSTVAAAMPTAIIHLAAWSDAGIVDDSRTYGDNVRSTFNLLQAAVGCGVEKVVIASSAQVYGLSRRPPDYVPIDELHPTRPTNSYAASKIANEGAGEYFSSAYGMPVLAFRIMGARTPEEIEGELAAAANPESDRELLWSRIDARDVATACRQALEVKDRPPGPYNIGGSHIVLPTETRRLMSRYWPGVKLRPSLTGSLSALSCAKAQAAFGFRPEFVWSQMTHHRKE